MGKRRESRPSRSMKPVFVVFCEGETEEAYLDFLKQTYRSPFKIIPKVEGGKISQHLIRKRCREVKISPNEKIQVFLMYDMDKPEITEKLLQLKAHLLLSNPCIELWFLLHCKDQKTAISTEDSIKALKHKGAPWNSYKKPEISTTQKEYLKQHVQEAMKRAASLPVHGNPSSDVHHLLRSILISVDKNSPVF